jgi:hypothetical protein
MKATTGVYGPCNKLPTTLARVSGARFAITCDTAGDADFNRTNRSHAPINA